MSLTQELILVDKVDISDADNTLINVIFEVKPALFQPLEIVNVLDVMLHLQGKCAMNSLGKNVMADGERCLTSPS